MQLADASASSVQPISTLLGNIEPESEKMSDVKLDMMKQISEASAVMSANTKDMRQAIKQVHV